MLKTAEGTIVRKSVRVGVPIEQAFSVFVEQMETWWPAEHHIGGKPFESIIVEPRVGGRWYERDGGGEGLRLGDGAGVGSTAVGDADVAFGADVEV